MVSGFRQKIGAAVVAPILLVAFAAQGLEYFRCMSGKVSLSPCCANERQRFDPSASRLAAGEAQCCDTLAISGTDVQEQPVAQGTVVPPPAHVAETVVAVPAPLVGEIPLVAATSPPRWRSLAFAYCALLI